MYKSLRFSEGGGRGVERRRGVMGELGGLESKDLGSWGAVRGMEEPGGVISDLCRRCVGCVRLCLIN